VPKNDKAIKFSFVADPVAGTIEGRIVPKLKRGVSTDIKPYLSTILSSIRLGLVAVLADLPVMRPATKNEVDAKAYIFKDGNKDNALYQTRKAIHDTIAKVFNDTLKELFPDVQFIAESIAHQQETVTEMSPEEAADHKRFIEDLAKEVKEEDNTNNDGTKM
jgi:uncharacterized protein (DUF305 family)